MKMSKSWRIVQKWCSTDPFWPPKIVLVHWHQYQGTSDQNRKESGRFSENVKENNSDRYFQKTQAYQIWTDEKIWKLYTKVQFSIVHHFRLIMSILLTLTTVVFRHSTTVSISLVISWSKDDEVAASLLDGVHLRKYFNLLSMYLLFLFTSECYKIMIIRKWAEVYYLRLKWEISQSWPMRSSFFFLSMDCFQIERWVPLCKYWSTVCAFFLSVSQPVRILVV